MSEFLQNLREDQAERLHHDPQPAGSVPHQSHAARSRVAMVADVAGAFLSALAETLARFLGRRDRYQLQPVTAFGAFHSPLFLGEVLEGKIEREADIEHQGARVGLGFGRRDDSQFSHSASVPLSVGDAGAAGIFGNDRVTTEESPAAPVGVGVGRPIGSSSSAVPGFTARRVELRYSVETVAALLTLGTHDLRGVHTTFQAVSAWERGENRPSEDRIDLLAEILSVPRVTVEEWFGLGIVSEVFHAA